VERDRDVIAAPAQSGASGPVAVALFATVFGAVATRVAAVVSETTWIIAVAVVMAAQLGAVLWLTIAARGRPRPLPWSMRAANLVVGVCVALTLLDAMHTAVETGNL
jgi:hypothetical protein